MTVDPESLTPFELSQAMSGLGVLSALSGSEPMVLIFDDLTPAERKQGFVWALND